MEGREPDKGPKKGPDWDQADVLRHKDGVTRSGRGLQIWGDASGAEEGTPGNASEGTAARAARVTKDQDRDPERAGKE